MLTGTNTTQLTQQASVTLTDVVKLVESGPSTVP